MEIAKNSRQVVKEAKWLESKKEYSDIVYGYLQVISKYDYVEQVRYLDKEQIRFVDIAEALDISRQTVSTKFKAMLDTNDKGPQLISYNEKKDRYELKKLGGTEGFLIPFETLRKMTSTFNERAINIYVVVVNRFYAANQQPYVLDITSLKSAVGLGIKTRSNNYLVTDVLEIYKKLGLINYIVTSEEIDGNFKTNYIVTGVNNIIDGDKIDLVSREDLKKNKEKNE